MGKRPAKAAAASWNPKVIRNRCPRRRVPGRASRLTSVSTDISLLLPPRILCRQPRVVRIGSSAAAGLVCRSRGARRFEQIGEPPQGMDDFWLQQGTSMLLSLVKSSQEDVYECAAITLATFVVIDDETANVDAARSEAVMRDGGIPLLLDLARCSRVSAQSEVAKVQTYL